MSFLSGKRVLVTGGASFIGSHLVDKLVKMDVGHVRVVDDLSSGKRHWLNVEAEFHQSDLRNPVACRGATMGIDVVFHLAADHGGRGYVDTHEAQCAVNLVIDSNMMYSARDNNVQRFVYASSGCVYPNYKQTDPTEELWLEEDDVGPPYDPDHMYGWAKLTGELSLKAFCEASMIEGSSLRYFTAYGPRAKEDHAVMAMMARALIRQNPFQIWGDGTQIRNWTHVSDIVEGTIKAAQILKGGEAVNLGTDERISVIEAATEICEYAGYKDPFFEFLPDNPTGPLNRTASNELAQLWLGWTPALGFSEGMRDTYEWYVENRDVEELKNDLESRLFNR